MLDGPDAPIPIRSGATHRASGATCGMILRHRYDEVGLPCRNTTGSPLPVSAYDIEVPSSSTFLRGCGSVAEICVSLLLMCGVSCWNFFSIRRTLTGLGHSANLLVVRSEIIGAERLTTESA